MNAEEKDTGLPAETPAHPLRYSKRDRLHHRNLVEKLFAEGESTYCFPLRMVYKVTESQDMEQTFRNGMPADISHLQMMVTVPKKKRRHAVDRVLMRRRIREAWRLNRLPLNRAIESLPDSPYVQIAFVYLHNDNLPYKEIELKMTRLIARLKKHLCPDPE